MGTDTDTDTDTDTMLAGDDDTSARRLVHGSDLMPLVNDMMHLVGLLRAKPRDWKAIDAAMEEKLEAAEVTMAFMLANRAGVLERSLAAPLDEDTWKDLAWEVVDAPNWVAFYREHEMAIADELDKAMSHAASACDLFKRLGLNQLIVLKLFRSCIDLMYGYGTKPLPAHPWLERRHAAARLEQPQQTTKRRRVVGSDDARAKRERQRTSANFRQRMKRLREREDARAALPDEARPVIKECDRRLFSALTRAVRVKYRSEYNEYREKRKREGKRICALDPIVDDPRDDNA
jgi:hypothetical protein